MNFKIFKSIIGLTVLSVVSIFILSQGKCSKSEMVKVPVDISFMNPANNRGATIL